MWENKTVSLVIITILVLSTVYITKIDEAKGTNVAILYVGGSGPGNYTTIQDAIDNASDGYTVFVFNGIYYENVAVDKQLNLIGESKNDTIIDAGGSGSAVRVSADWVKISDFTLQNSGNGWYTAGILLSSSSNYNTITKNKIINN